MRFEHFYEKDEDAKLSQPATFDIRGLFAGITFDTFDTLGLGANVKEADLQRLKWNTNELQGKMKRNAPLKYRPKYAGDNDDWQITLEPMEIRTLLFNSTIAERMRSVG